jgi:hypothetical protein
MLSEDNEVLYVKNVQNYSELFEFIYLRIAGSDYTCI